MYEAVAVPGEQLKRPTVIQQSHNPRANVAGAQAYGTPAVASAGGAAAAPDVHDGDSTLLAAPSPERHHQLQQQGIKGNQSPGLMVDLSASPVSLRRGLPSDNIPSGARLARRTRFVSTALNMYGKLRFNTSYKFRDPEYIFIILYIFNFPRYYSHSSRRDRVVRAYQHALVAEETDKVPAAPPSRDVYEMPIAEDENEDVPVSNAERKSSRGATTASQMGIAPTADEGGNVVFHPHRQSGNGFPAQRPVLGAPPPPGFQSDSYAPSAQQQSGGVSGPPAGRRVSPSPGPSAYSRGVPSSGVQSQPTYYQRAPPPPGSAAPHANSPPPPPGSADPHANFPPPPSQLQQFAPTQPPPEFSDGASGRIVILF